MMIVISLNQCGMVERYSVAEGNYVSISSFYDAECKDPALSGNSTANNCYWRANTLSNEWIQVSTVIPQKWVAVITQGNPMYDWWVTQYKVLYSMDGITWS